MEAEVGTKERAPTQAPLPSLFSARPTGGHAGGALARRGLITTTSFSPLLHVLPFMHRQSPSEHSRAAADALDPASRGDGKAGGSWGLCTHLKSYGLNADFGIMSVLLALRPRTSLELGSGVGLYSSWLSRMAGTDAIGIEPKPLMRGVIESHPLGAGSLSQLVANFVNASGEAAACDSALPKFDLVFSINMAEHLPLWMHEPVADFLARHVHGFLVFAAGVPGEPGIGHIGNRPLEQWKEMFVRRGLVHLPKTSIKLRGTARNVDNRKNFQAFTTPAAPLGRAWDDPYDERVKAVAARKRSDFPPASHAWLASKECLGAVRASIEAHNRDLCNATHSVATFADGEKPGHRINATVALPQRMSPTNSGPPVRVPWLARHRLRLGELFLWPELVVEQSKCWIYSPMVRQKLEAAQAQGLLGLGRTTLLRPSTTMAGAK